jgi:hypothetical protein
MTQFHNCLSKEERGKAMISIGISLPLADIFVKALAIYANMNNVDEQFAKDAAQQIDALIYKEEVKIADRKAGLKWDSENIHILKN